MLPGPLQMQVALTSPLEIGAVSPETAALRAAAGPLVLGAVLLIVIAVFLRLAFGQSDRAKIAPAIVVVMAMLVLAGAWGIRQGVTPPHVEAAP